MIEILLNTINDGFYSSSSVEAVETTNPATAKVLAAVEFYTQTKVVVERRPNHWSRKF